MDILTPEQIAALPADQQAVYYKGLYDAEVTAHTSTQSNLATAQSDLASEQSAHSQTKTDATEEIGKLSAQLSNATKAAAQGYLSVEIAGKNYKVIGKSFQIAGEVISVENLVKDTEKLEWMVSKGSGSLVALD